MDNPVFLSVDVPDPRRDPDYCTDVDRMAIREAVKALAAVVLPRTELVFRGVAGVSSLIDAVAGGLSRTVGPPNGPDCSGRVERIHNGAEREVLWRRLVRGPFTAGVFIGGMERAEEEFELFRTANPGAKLLPVASTGGAARMLLDRIEEGVLSEEERKMLRDNLVYRAMFEDLLWGGIRGQR